MDTIERELAQLEEAMPRIWDVAQELGLDPFPVRFELVPSAIMYEFGAYGIPGRFAHWTHGKAFYRMKTQYDYGLSKIYELVINANPSYAFLMEGNSVLQNKLVIAHVLGHCDFFKHNHYFGRTNRSMVDTASLNAERIRRYEMLHGRHEVELFLDAVLAIQEHVDPHLSFRRKSAAESAAERDQARRTRPSSGFEDLWDVDGELTQQRAAEEAERRRASVRFPAEPEKDLLLFLLEHAPDLQDWQRDVIGIVRSEMLYFVPQMQTKIMNEGWACATGDALVLSEAGFLRFDELYERAGQLSVASGSSGETHPVTDRHRESQVPTIRVRTRRGLSIEGALGHRVLLSNGEWARLDEVKLGDQIALQVGANIWSQSSPTIDYTPAVRTPSLSTVAATAGTSLPTVLRHMKGRRTIRGSHIAAAMSALDYQPQRTGRTLATRTPLQAPRQPTEEVAWFLGYFVGDGNLTQSGICLTTGDVELRDRVAGILQRCFGLSPTIKWDPTDTGGRWRIVVHSRELFRWLKAVGINLQATAPAKQIPGIILRSTKPIMSAFLRGYFDADAYAGKEGVRLVSSSLELIRSVQIVLLNYGILSTQRPKSDGCTHLEITGASAERFLSNIGFGLERKAAALYTYVTGHKWYKDESSTDTITDIEYSCADVFDITVASKHSYVANGFINHNSYYHARILRDLDLTDDETIEFASLNAGVVSPHRRSINPYHLGLKIFEDIERRWDNPTAEERERLGRQPGEGRAKLFEVRELDNDVSFIRNYLTKDLVEELDLYLYERQGNEWVIVEKDWEKVRDGLLHQMTNFGNPTICVEDGDYRRNRELYLKHYFEGTELDVSYAEKTLQYIYQLWGRPVHLETLLDDEQVIFSYDGQKNSRTTL